MRFAIVALLILGVLATGAFLGWSTTPTRTVVPAIELRAAPLGETSTQLADPDAKPKARSTARPRNAAASRTANRPQAPRPVSNRQAEPAAESVPASERVASTQSPRRETPAAGNAPRGGDTDDGGGTANGNNQTPPTTIPAPQSPTVGAAAAPAAPPAPAGGEDDDDEDADDGGGDDDGDDGGDDG